MAAPVLGKVSYEPIKAAYLLGGLGFPAMDREAEGATKTFKLGVPLVMSGGNLQEAAFGGAETVYGVSSEPAHNLATANTAQDLNEGSPPNQPNAVTTPVGAWIRDGKCGFYRADGKTVFSISLKTAQTFSQALIVPGTYYGLTKDGTSGFWYLDTADTAGDNAVAQLVGMDPSSPNTAADGCRVYFIFKASLRAFA